MNTGFYRDVGGKLREIFCKHCNLSGEQYQEIEKRLVFMVATIQDGYPIEDTEEDASELHTIFEFLYQTHELTFEEYNELCIFVNEMLEEAQKIDEMQQEDEKRSAEGATSAERSEIK